MLRILLLILLLGAPSLSNARQLEPSDLSEANRERLARAFFERRSVLDVAISNNGFPSFLNPRQITLNERARIDALKTFLKEATRQGRWEELRTAGTNRFLVLRYQDQKYKFDVRFLVKLGGLEYSESQDGKIDMEKISQQARLGRQGDLEIFYCPSNSVIRPDKLTEVQARRIISKILSEQKSLAAFRHALGGHGLLSQASDKSKFFVSTLPDLKKIFLYAARKGSIYGLNEEDVSILLRFKRSDFGENETDERLPSTYVHDGNKIGIAQGQETEYMKMVVKLSNLCMHSAGASKEDRFDPSWVLGSISQRGIDRGALKTGYPIPEATYRYDKIRLNRLPEHRGF